MTPGAADVVVVGGGLIGSALAYELVAAGADTVLVDRHHPGRATDAGAGILSPETTLDPSPEMFAFGRAAARHYPVLIERLAGDGVADAGFAVTGLLVVSERPGDDAVMEQAVALVRQRVPGVTEETPGEAAERFPPLGPVRRALFNPWGRRVDGRTLNSALREAALSRGLRVVEGTATGIGAGGGKGTVTSVSTGDTAIPTGAVVVAGGAWSARLGEHLGVDLPVSPLKGQIVHLTLPATDSRDWPVVQPVLGFYLVPWPGGRIACGGTMEAEAGFDHRPTADGLHQLLRGCLHTAPGLGSATVTEVRVGSRPSTPDSRPVLGPLPGWSNAFVATGHGAEGLLLGPYSARLVARQALGLPVADDPSEAADASGVLELCAPGRFGR